MSLIEFMCREMFGPPKSGRSWYCPLCDSNQASFWIRDPDAKGKVRFLCFHCEERGDEYDLLKKLHPHEDYGDRKIRIARMQKKFKNSAHSKTSAGSRPSSFGGVQARQKLDTAYAEVQTVMESHGIELRAGTTLLSEFAKACKRGGVLPQTLIDEFVDTQRWHDESFKEHVDECDDPDCDVDGCIEARGLTTEDRDRIREEQAEAKRLFDEKIKRAIRKRPVLGGKSK